MDGNASVPVGRRMRRVAEQSDRRELACEDVGRDMEAPEGHERDGREAQTVSGHRRTATLLVLKRNCMVQVAQKNQAHFQIHFMDAHSADSTL